VPGAAGGDKLIAEGKSCTVRVPKGFGRLKEARRQNSGPAVKPSLTSTVKQKKLGPDVWTVADALPAKPSRLLRVGGC
ncbi:MAG: hypothetical protein J5600_01505, partial [Desulfovibrio sp.]|nr:hypothetical protein [Desulfovibrio sp.]